MATAQGLFHSRGYDGVSVADVTSAIGINAPSFYAAFGSKAGLYDQVLQRWACTGAIPLQDILRTDRLVEASLVDLLTEAARQYAADPDATGCLVLEGTRSNDADARQAASAYSVAAQEAIREYIAQRHPESADLLADYVCTTMVGLSAQARNGLDRNRLLEVAETAGLAISRVLTD
ncbi:TetR/AcrR family transcriptional regulator [Qipengyuania qiaonensis]|uniref:TetR/AcrR family transcriptional regulator helix-turn-helix transcriptional regulator n=1 Tax=Qipengyuania qiaonensis TaxID=2867240 RepID=A0ABS7J604_9SPHN|nr:TetR/AcrR family transcriptional regulator; helix-turn-helix transcriptional regulator [Qipengyuania qiaonensis]